MAYNPCPDHDSPFTNLVLLEPYPLCAETMMTGLRIASYNAVRRAASRSDKRMWIPTRVELVGLKAAGHVTEPVDTDGMSAE